MKRLLAVIALLAASTTTATANPTGTSDVDPADEQHPWTALGEILIANAIPASAYWLTKEHQAVDFDLDGSWKSWKLKLFSTDKLKFDTNPFHVNAVRHPIQGVIDYQIIRTNGFSSTVSLLVAVVKGIAWELCVEYREDPSLNDIIFNPAAAMAIGEPMYQIGQLWRGSRLTLADRLRTAAFSPFDALHDTYRHSKRWFRPSVWRTVDFAAGASERVVQTKWIGEATASADIDLVASRAFAEGGNYDDWTRTGDWTRMRISARIGEGADGTALTGTALKSRTSWMGRYTQNENGDGQFFGLGTAFTYRNDWLGTDKDRIAIAHLVGPQIQLSHRRPNYELRWDIAGYVDFALVQALVFNRGEPRFPRPPPYFSSLQSDGYIDAVGTSVSTRLRVDAGALHFDLEIDANAMRQVSYRDRDPDGKGSDVPITPTKPVTATGVNEQRGLWRAQLAYRPCRWGFAVSAEGAERRSTWQDEKREVTELSLGAQVLLAY